MNETIPYETFAQLHLRVGTIQSVEPLPDADKLLKLSVDIGEEAPRQIIAGIAPAYGDGSELVGQQCVLLANLEPKTLRGHESHGMLLAAGSGDAIALLQPSAPMPAGTVVS